MCFKYIKARLVCLCIMVLFVIYVVSISSLCFSGQAESYITKAKKFENEGQYSTAINEYFKAINKEPSHPYTYYHLGIISEFVLNDYNSSAQFYEKALSLLKFNNIFISEELLFNNDQNLNKKNIIPTLSSPEKPDYTIADIESRKTVLVEKIFNSIENPIYPINIVLKQKKGVYSEPISSSKSISVEKLEGQNEFKFLEITDNWYRVELPSKSEGWIKWKDINLIYQNKSNPVRFSKLEKAKEYAIFNKKFSNNVLSVKAKGKMDILFYEIAMESNQIEDYKVYLSNCPDGKFVNNSKMRIAQIQNDLGKTQKLKKLEDLYKKGLIDEKNYLKKKNEISKGL